MCEMAGLLALATAVGGGAIFALTWLSFTADPLLARGPYGRWWDVTRWLLTPSSYDGVLRWALSFLLMWGPAAVLAAVLARRNRRYADQREQLVEAPRGRFRREATLVLLTALGGVALGWCAALPVQLRHSALEWELRNPQFATLGWVDCYTRVCDLHGVLAIVAVFVSLTFPVVLVPVLVCGLAPSGRTGTNPALQCARCGYSLRGLPAPRCPECGHVSAQ